MEILSKFRAVQSLVFVYMLVIVIDISGMFPMRTIFCLTCNRNISQKKTGNYSIFGRHCLP